MFDRDIGGALVLDGFDGDEFAVDGEEEVLGVVVEFVVEAVDVVEEGVVPHHLHHLAEHLGPGPVSTVVFQGYYELQHLHLRQPPYSVFV